MFVRDMWFVFDIRDIWFVFMKCSWLFIIGNNHISDSSYLRCYLIFRGVCLVFTQPSPALPSLLFSVSIWLLLSTIKRDNVLWAIICIISDEILIDSQWWNIDKQWWFMPWWNVHRVYSFSRYIFLKCSFSVGNNIPCVPLSLLSLSLSLSDPFLRSIRYL